MISEFSKAEKCSGYIALISVVMISLLLITISVVISFSSFFSRFSILDNEYKEISNGLAEGCANVAILNLAGDWSYAGGVSVMVGTNSCQIRPIEAGFPKVIRVQAFYPQLGSSASFTNLQISVSSTTEGVPTIISWEELPKLPLP